jgi:hypothetical protein
MAGVGPSVLEPTACELVRPSFSSSDLSLTLLAFYLAQVKRFSRIKVTPKIKKLNIV